LRNITFSTPHSRWGLLIYAKTAPSKPVEKTIKINWTATKLKNRLYKKQLLSDTPFCKIIRSRATLEPTASRAKFRDPSRFHFGHDDYYRQVKSSVLILAAAANGFIYKDLLSSLLQLPTDQPKHCKQLPEKQTSLDTPPVRSNPALAAMLDFVT